MRFMEVKLPDEKWVPMQPVRHANILFGDIRIVPPLFKLWTLLAKLGLESPEAAILMEAGIYK